LCISLLKRRVFKNAHYHQNMLHCNKSRPSKLISLKFDKGKFH
jgi:hypothetical protein